MRDLDRLYRGRADATRQQAQGADGSAVGLEQIFDAFNRNRRILPRTVVDQLDGRRQVIP